MTAKKRMGIDPFESPIEKHLIKDTREEGKKDTKNKDITIKGYKDNKSKKEQAIRKAIATGETQNYYINKNDEVVTRILVHLPFDLAEKLREEAFNSVPRKSLSSVIRERLKS